MASVNKVILLGYVGKDPETRYTGGGDPVTNFSMATSEQWKDKEGEKQERTEWHRVQVWGKLAEIAGEYVKKGHLVYIEGRIRTNKFSDKDGVEHENKEIVCETLRMLTPRDSNAPRNGNTRPAAAKPATPERKPAQQDFDDDIPF